MDEIPSDQLQLSDIPAEDASLEELLDFEAFGSFEDCADIASAQDHSSLDHLRACLFFEARSLRHCDSDPGPEELAYWRLVVSKIRTCIEERVAGG